MSFNYFTNLFKKKKEEDELPKKTTDEKEFRDRILGEFTVPDHYTSTSIDPEVVRMYEEMMKQNGSITTTGSTTGKYFQGSDGQWKIGGLDYGKIGGIGDTSDAWRYNGYDKYGTYKPVPYPYSDMTEEKRKELLEMLKQQRQGDPNVEAWKVSLLQHLLIMVNDPDQHKHPNQSWKFLEFFKTNFNYQGPIAATEFNAMARWLCNDTKYNSDNYKKLFSLDDFIFALFGDSKAKVDCECNGECSCTGRTLLEYHTEQLQGDQPFEYLRDFFRDEV